MYALIDTHAHLDEIPDLEGELARARAAGVSGIVAVGQGLASNRKILQLAAMHQGFVYPALGLHPWNLADEDLEENLAFIRENVGWAVAVGEIGLDYDKRVRARAAKERQQEVFRELLTIARNGGKPALVHSRYAWQDALTLVAQSGVAGAVFHWYTGTSSVLREIIARGYYLSAGPAVEYHEEHRRAVKEVPPARLLLETDAPVTYRRGTPQEYRSGPADVRRVLAELVRLRGESEAELAAITTANAVRLFGINAD